MRRESVPPHCYAGRRNRSFRRLSARPDAAHFAQTTARLQQMSSAAVATLGKVMVDQGAAASTRVRAAEAIINHAAKGIEMEDIEARVTELERAAGTPKPGERFGGPL